MGNQLRANVETISWEDAVFIPAYCAQCEKYLDGINPLPRINLSRDGQGIIMSLWFCKEQCLNEFIPTYDMYKVYDILRSFMVRSIASDKSSGRRQSDVTFQEHIDMFKMMIGKAKRKKNEKPY